MDACLFSGWVQYDEKYSEADVLEGWKRMLTRYGAKWNLAALDLKNEPHDIATWVRPLTRAGGGDHGTRKIVIHNWGKQGNQLGLCLYVSLGG